MPCHVTSPDFLISSKKIVDLQSCLLCHNQSAALALSPIGQSCASFSFRVGPLSKVKGVCVQKVCTTPRAADKSGDGSSFGESALNGFFVL
jgi:hypothetical protein